MDTLVERGFIDADDAVSLQQTSGVLPVDVADKMVENVVSVFGLPLAVAPNFLVNGRDYVVPMVIEEPSVVAGVSGAARLMRHGGGFIARADDPILIGQVQLVDVADPDKTIELLRVAEEKLLQDANNLQPNLLRRGGGARSIEFLKYKLADERWTVIAHIAVDTRDAMGANLVNTICEGIAPEFEVVITQPCLIRVDMPLSGIHDFGRQARRCHRVIQGAELPVEFERVGAGADDSVGNVSVSGALKQRHRVAHGVGVEIPGN